MGCKKSNQTKQTNTVMEQKSWADPEGGGGGGGGGGVGPDPTWKITSGYRPP